MDRTSSVWWPLALALGLALPQAGAAQAPDATEAHIMQSAGFLAAHPDLDNRAKGWHAYNRGEFEQAATCFRRAARYADKPSQGMVAGMLRNGEDGPRDPVMAYVWVDLAAERVHEGFLLLRERYWRELDASQRADAVARGQAVYAGSAMRWPGHAWRPSCAARAAG